MCSCDQSSCDPLFSAIPRHWHFQVRGRLCSSDYCDASSSKVIVFSNSKALASSSCSRETVLKRLLRRLIGGVLGDSAPNTSQWILPSAVIFSIDDLEILASDDLDCSVDMRSMSEGNVRRRRSIGLLCKGHTIIVERYTHQSFLPIRRWRCEYLPLQGLEQVQFWFSPSAACLLYAPWVGQALSSTTWSTWSKHDHWNDHWFHHETILRQCT